MKSKLAILSLIVTLALGSLGLAQSTERRLGRVRWAPDQQHLQVGRKWIHPGTLKEVEPVDVAEEVDPRAGRREAFEAALEAAIGRNVPMSVLRGRRAMSTLPRARTRYPGMRASEDQKRAALVLEGDLWTWAEGSPAKKVASDLGGIRHFETAPDGAWLSWIKENDLYIANARTGETRRLTKDGSDGIFNGELDWVYQEEVWGRFQFKGTWWSPNSETLAWIRIDENGVDTFSVVDHIPNALTVERLRYPKAGSTNPRASVWATRARDGHAVQFDLTDYPSEAEILIVRVGWTPEGDRVVFQVQNREQTWLDLVFGDPETGRVETIIHEECKDGWVNVLSMPRWLEDGSFLWESERTGFKHLYRYDRKGKLLAKVTQGDWELRSIIRIDEKRGHVSYYCSKGGATGLHAGRSTLDGKKSMMLSRGRGTHDIQLSADGEYLIDRFHNMEMAGQQWVRKAGEEGYLSWEARSRSSSTSAKLHRIKARDGEFLDVSVNLPRNFDESSKYPVWIHTYSGPDAPTISDSWGSGNRQAGWYVRNGIIFLRVNVRSASGRGMRYTKSCFRQFGVQELKDIEDAVKWLCENSWADASRVGIDGWSYGGFITAYALTHSKLFKCGIAGGGVYDWRLYDTIYTERYMGKPQNNADGYRISSVVEAAGDLHGELLIVHGTMDDNVHLQNAIQFVHALQTAGKQNFRFMPYPRARHGVGSSHLRALRRRFIEANL